MVARIRASFAIATIAALVVLSLPPTARAVDGVILIDQNRALAGNVTPGDAPGFPVTITRSGSYRLSSDLTLPNADTTGIQITSAADHVTIDLNGFAIVGPTVCSGPPGGAVTDCDPTSAVPATQGIGILSNATASVTIRNGTIRGAGSTGIRVTSDSPFDPSAAVTISEVHIVSNGGDGIRSGGRGTIVRNNVVRRNGAAGIGAANGLVEGNSIRENLGNGVLMLGLSLLVLDNHIEFNGGFGVRNSIAAGPVALGRNKIVSNGGTILGGFLQLQPNQCGNDLTCP